MSSPTPHRSCSECFKSTGDLPADSSQQLYTTVQEVSTALCRRLGVRNPHHTVEDIAQDVCLKLVRLGLFDRLAARVERGENVRAFLKACVLNAIRDYMRRAARHPELESEVLGSDSGFDQHFISTATEGNDVDLGDVIEALCSECSSPADARMFAVLDEHVGAGATVVDACRGLMSPSMFRHVRSQFRKKPKVRRILRDCA